LQQIKGKTDYLFFENLNKEEIKANSLDEENV